jgi:MFS family permease
MTNFAEVWRSYTALEKRNIAFYIAGIMFYKLGLEFFNGSITTLATDRFKAASTFTKLGAAQGVNQAAQCVGAILIAPLIKKWPTRTVLAFGVLLFALMTTILLIVDAATGGKLKPANQTKPIYGSWNPNLIFVVWTLSGIAYGMVELIRRVIPADILGGHVSKLRRMDATVHVFYEIAGTIGAFASSSAISRFGNNYSFFLTPVFFAVAAGFWVFISTLSFVSDTDKENVGLEEVDFMRKGAGYFIQIGYGAIHFCESIWVGTKLVLGHRRFIWLFPSYSVALYLHRFIESSLAPAFAKRVLGISAWSQIINGGSNFGELLGALSVFLLSDYVTTPLPWLRLDALALNLAWLLPYYATRSKKTVASAWKLACCFIPISFGWAAGDVSLAAYIQATLSSSDFAQESSHVSSLGAVMAFLYSTYIVLNAVFSSVLGKVIDKDSEKFKGDIHRSLRQVAGIHYSVGCGIIMLSTLIPVGAFALNPKIIGDVPLAGEPGQESSDDGEGEGEHEYKKERISDADVDTDKKEVITA